MISLNHLIEANIRQDMQSYLKEKNGFIADTPGFSALDFDHIEKMM